MGKLITINDKNYRKYIDPTVKGEKKKCGTVPRDWKKYPHGSLMHAKPFDLPLIPEGEWADRLAEQKAGKTQLTDLRNVSGPDGKPIPSRDQNGFGFCWAHSSTSASLILRAIMGEPYADLSAFMVACIIKQYRDEGGWGSESLEFIAQNGIPTSEFWPQQSMSRSNDTPEMRANAKLHRFTNWRDLDPNAMKAQLVTCLLMGYPVVSDFNWWSHSVCTVALVSLDPFKTTIWNSWGNWSDNGMGNLEGSKAIPDSALVGMVHSASEV